MRCTWSSKETDQEKEFLGICIRNDDNNDDDDEDDDDVSAAHCWIATLEGIEFQSRIDGF